MSERRDFDVFYRDCHVEIARALVLAVGHRELGLDAADEAFTRAFERWDEVRDYENTEGWLYRVGLNWARSKIRRRSLTVDKLLGEAVHLDDLPEPELLAAVERLAFKYRSVMVAR